MLVNESSKKLHHLFLTQGGTRQDSRFVNRSNPRAPLRPRDDPSGQDEERASNAPEGDPKLKHRPTDCLLSNCLLMVFISPE